MGTTLLDPSIPPPGVGYYYIIRGEAPQLEAGTLDNVPGLTAPEGRDQAVGTAGGYSEQGHRAAGQPWLFHQPADGKVYGNPRPA